MDSITACPICYNKYSKPFYLPLIINCGHTFCKECAEKMTKCPLCRQSFTSSTVNLILFQISTISGDICSHEWKNLFCPLCTIPLCVSCVPLHNMHGLLPLSDPKVSFLIDENISESISNLDTGNSSLFEDLDKVTRLKYNFKSKHDKYTRTINQEYSVIINRLNTRKQELFDELDSLFTPIFSKLDILLTEIDKAISENREVLKTLKNVKGMPVETKVQHLNVCQSKTINLKMMEKICERAKVLPCLTVDSCKTLATLEYWGRFKAPSNNFLGLFL